jgi:hypothetical protein
LGRGFLSHPGPEAVWVYSTTVLLSLCPGSCSEPWWWFLLRQQPPPRLGPPYSEPKPEYVEGTCAHRHRQCALRVLHLWPARSQVSGLSAEGPSSSNPYWTGTSSGSASKASRGSHPWLSHSPDHGGRSGCPRRGVRYVFGTGSFSLGSFFDSGATCSYRASKFAREHNIPVTPRSVPIDTISP